MLEKSTNLKQVIKDIYAALQYAAPNKTVDEDTPP